MLRWKIFLVVIAVMLACFKLKAQIGCTTLGQTPSTAFPVCGTDTFSQATVPICTNQSITVPHCPKGPNLDYTDRNPFWYKFTCYTSGTLGFLVTPNNLEDDYDWQLYDITGRNADDVYTDSSLAITGNWSGNTSLESSRGYTGVTGAQTGATSDFICASNPPELGGLPPFSDATTFCKMPAIIIGHTYLLMVSHYTNSQTGYKLSFGGGTAVITDTAPPAIKIANATCDGTQLRVVTNKRMKCVSLALDGSDFSINTTAATIISASGAGCSNSFDMDSVILTFSNALPPGNYTLTMQDGTDDNTLFDNCSSEIPVGSSIPFTIYGRQPTPLDSIVPPQCAPQTLQLVFQKNIKCSSLAKDGTDFKITGPYPVTVATETGNCSSDVTSIVNVVLTAPVVHAGTYTIQLLTGLDGNSIIDECGEETPPSTIEFTVQDTVGAEFTYNIIEGCRVDTIYYFNNGGGSITNWYWNFDTTQTSSEQNPVQYYTIFGDKTASLIVTNGFCSDTSTVNFYLDKDSLRASFNSPVVFCPSEPAMFTDTSMGNIIQWYWSFGNGHTYNGQTPPLQNYYTNKPVQYFPVQLIIESNKQCFDTTVKILKAVNNCSIAVPSAFTPNGDGRNDYLYPLNAYKATNLSFRVYNRWGQLVFETKDWTHKWDGTISNTPQSPGVYVWALEYTNIDTGQKISTKGTVVLIR